MSVKILHRTSKKPQTEDYDDIAKANGRSAYSGIEEVADWKYSQIKKYWNSDYFSRGEADLHK
jgi:hypothetical protein